MSTTPPYSPTNLRNRPFYRYGDHIELLRFKEYCGMPRGHEHDPIYSLSINYLRVFLEKDCNGKKDRRAVFGCNSDCLFPEK